MSSEQDTGGTGRVGVLAVGLLVEKKLNWAFREQLANDFGIDAQAESKTATGKLDGRLIALQIKAGPSYFKEETRQGYVFRGDASHLDYWRRHSLPVIVVLHQPETELTLWEVISPETVKSTGKGWKVVVPRSNILDARASNAWLALSEGPLYQRRLRALVLANRG